MTCRGVDPCSLAKFGLAPLFISSSTTLTLPLAKAKCNGASPVFGTRQLGSCPRERYSQTAELTAVYVCTCRLCYTYMCLRAAGVKSDEQPGELLLAQRAKLIISRFMYICARRKLGVVVRCGASKNATRALQQLLYSAMCKLIEFSNSSIAYTLPRMRSFASTSRSRARIRKHIRAHELAQVSIYFTRCTLRAPSALFANEIFSASSLLSPYIYIGPRASFSSALLHSIYVYIDPCARHVSGSIIYPFRARYRQRQHQPSQ
ncbi:unnamed protein product [Trichogramma brassicae]|uniref:Uncharacterized protein n=1 Tax=Trichogramma brassicae TaxID=86971 RepID=A0A6H5IZ97_9HYME|nr:unnamed protein product [Trichogramma brassicae]